MIKSAKSESGAVLLEFVLCFPILMVLFLFAVQFSYIMIAWQVVHYSAYMGARSAMTENVFQRKSKAEKVVKRILAVVSASPTDSKDAKDRAKDEYSKLDGWGWLPNTKFLDQQVDVDISMTNLDPRGVICTVKFKALLTVPVAGSLVFLQKRINQKTSKNGRSRSTSRNTPSIPRFWIIQTKSSSTAGIKRKSLNFRT